MVKPFHKPDGDRTVFPTIAEASSRALFDRFGRPLAEPQLRQLGWIFGTTKTLEHHQVKKTCTGIPAGSPT
jgi:hypothetical protein